jgi:spermidine/putrescine transport system substrate-binding protein
MKRRTLFLMGLAGAAGCSRGRERRLNVFNWSSYVAADTIPNFEREFGVHVRYAVYESNEEMFARVMTGNSGWDVVFPTNYFIEPMREMGLLAELDHGLLRNLDQLDIPFRRPSWDPDLRWSIPYMWNATGIAYNKEAGPAPLSWRDLWGERMAGHLTMLDDPVDVFGACLKKLRYSYFSSNPDELRKAQAEAVAQKRLVRAYVNAEVRDQLISGDVLVAQMWSTNAQQAIDATPKVAFAYPLEGYPLYPDCSVILRESPRRQIAHQFIDYLLRPKVAAAIVETARTATANGGARAFLPDSLRANPVIFPPAAIMSRGEWPLPQPPAIQRLRDRLWTEVKSS